MADFDPSDWKNTRLPKLAQLDSLQRCLICKDFLRAPVMTSCNHTFCSQCIRQHLLSESLCPLCKAEQFESNLKRVILLEEIVSCFQDLRPALIALATQSQEQDDIRSTQNETNSVLKNVGHRDNMVSSSSEKEKKKLQEEKDSGVIEVPDTENVSCPVCNERMPADLLQRKHLDECLRGTTRPKRRRTEILLFFQPRKKREIDHEHFYFSEAHKHHHEARRMPKMDYASLSTPKLKEKLAQLHLSILGTRSQLEMRYNHYYLLHNSNLDSSRPVLDLELRQKLKQWERSHSAFSAAASPNPLFGDLISHKSITDKDFSVLVWMDKYKQEFHALVRAAKRSRRKRGALESTITETTKSGVDFEEVTVDKDDSIEKNGSKINQNGSLNRGTQSLQGEKITESSIGLFSVPGKSEELHAAETPNAEKSSGVECHEPKIDASLNTASKIKINSKQDEVMNGDAAEFDFSSSTLFVKRHE